MLLFRSEEHVDRWCGLWSLPRGAAMTSETAWQLAKAWFAQNRAEPAWQRPSLETVQSLFASLGLQGPFWNLRP